MNKDENLDHDFLSLRAEEAEDRTFMGGMRLGARARLFVLTGLFALGAAAGLFVFADTRLSDALDNADGASRMAALAGQVELGVAKARGTEKAFLLAKDTALADVFQTHLTSVSVALERLARIPAAARQRKHMDTIRDGLAQYDEQFKKLVTSEKELGLKDDSGLSRELRNVTEDLQAKFSTAGYGNLAGQISRINQEGQETLLSGYKKGVEEIQKRYKTLIIFLKETKIPAKRKETLQTLLKQHETYLLAMINARFNLADETRQFDDLLSYLAPSINAIVGYSDRLSRGAAKDLIFMRTVSRAAIGGGMAGLLMLLMVVGLMVIRSMIEPVRELAAVAGRFADGDAKASPPGMGNSDATGTIARALGHWQEALSDLDQMRRELKETRADLQEALSRAEVSDMAASDAARAALLADETEEPAKEPVPATAAKPPAQPMLGPMPEILADLPPGLAGTGPISSVSRQLASFSQYVTAAADDVERTEALIRGLDDATRQMEEMGSLVVGIRDQTNLLAFRSGPRDTSGPDNLVILSGEHKESVDDKTFSDMNMSKRFDMIRETTERAERVTGTVRATMAEVTRMAREIAATASEQAIEATSKLLSQSEYLQNMLDDVISKVRPSDAPSGRADTRNGEAAPGEQQTPPKKA